jgi:hypothetical protein
MAIWCAVQAGLWYMRRFVVEIHLLGRQETSSGVIGSSEADEYATALPHKTSKFQVMEDQS